MLFPEPRQLELVRVFELSPTVRCLSFRANDGKPFVWNAGQYLEVAAADYGILKMAFSIASAKKPDRCSFELAVTLGPDTLRLCELPVGARVQANGPLGSFTREDPSPRPALFIGAGTGVAPLRAMIEKDLSTAGAQPLLLLFGCRTEEELLWGDEFHALARARPRFRFEPSLSRATAQWTGRRGWVQEHLRELVLPLGKVQAYVCGNQSMVRDCVRRLQDELSVEPSMISFEAH